MEWGREAVPWGNHWPLTFQVCTSESVDCLCVCEGARRCGGVCHMVWARVQQLYAHVQADMQ